MSVASRAMSFKVVLDLAGNEWSAEAIARTLRAIAAQIEADPEASSDHIVAQGSYVGEWFFEGLD